jgi:DNA-binding transcriptional LysR family regulator
MQFESLKVFCDVARYRSFSQAAAANHVSQSAVSQMVMQLEERMKVQLIDRSVRPLQLTAPGQIYYEGCKIFIDQYLELEASIHNAQASLAVTVQVAAIYSVGLGDMSQYVERFKARHPEATVQIEYLHPDRVVEKVLEGTADLGLISFPPRSRDLVAIPWREEEMVLVCSPAHPLARFKAVKPAQLEGEKFVGFDRELFIRRQVDRFLRDQGVTVEVALEFDNIETIKKATEVSAGVALLPEPTLRREVQAGTLVAKPLSGCRLVRPLAIIHRRQHMLSSSAKGFMDFLRHSHGEANDHQPGPAYFAAESEHSRNSSLNRNRNGASRPTKTAKKPD